jgi:hypothetical protein
MPPSEAGKAALTETGTLITGLRLAVLIRGWRAS